MMDKKVIKIVEYLTAIDFTSGTVTIDDTNNRLDIDDDKGHSLVISFDEKVMNAEEIYTVWEIALEELGYQRKRLHRPPGASLLRLSEFIYSRKKYETVLRPTIVDMREEYFEALAAGRKWKSRWVRVRGIWSFGAAVGLDIPISAIGLIRKIWTAAH